MLLIFAFVKSGMLLPGRRKAFAPPGFAVAAPEAAFAVSNQG